MREGVVGLEGRLVVVVVVLVGVVVLLLMGVLLGGGVARLMARVILLLLLYCIPYYGVQLCIPLILMHTAALFLIHYHNDTTHL